MAYFDYLGPEGQEEGVKEILAYMSDIRALSEQEITDDRADFFRSLMEEVAWDMLDALAFERYHS